MGGYQQPQRKTGLSHLLQLPSTHLSSLSLPWHFVFGASGATALLPELGVPTLAFLLVFGALEAAGLLQMLSGGAPLLLHKQTTVVFLAVAVPGGELLGCLCSSRARRPCRTSGSCRSASWRRSCSRRAPPPCCTSCGSRFPPFFGKSLEPTALLFLCALPALRSHHKNNQKSRSIK